MTTTELTLQQKYDILIAAVRFYAEPQTYHATFIMPDRPAGAINDDYSTHGHPDYYDGDVRPGYAARKALELCGEEPVDEVELNYDSPIMKELYTSYYDSDRDEKWAARGLILEDD